LVLIVVFTYFEYRVNLQYYIDMTVQRKVLSMLMLFTRIYHMVLKWYGIKRYIHMF